jgi:hypothetical protein
MAYFIFSLYFALGIEECLDVTYHTHKTMFVHMTPTGCGALFSWYVGRGSRGMKQILHRQLHLVPRLVSGAILLPRMSLLCAQGLYLHSRFSLFNGIYKSDGPVPVAARSKAWVCGRLPAGIVGSNPAGAWMFVCCECCVLSEVSVGLITRPEESYRLWYV